MSSSKAAQAAEASRSHHEDNDAPPEYTIAPVDDLSIDPEEQTFIQDVSNLQEQQQEDLGDVPPPAYTDVYGTLGFSQDGMNTTAQVQNDGRININIEKSGRLSQLLAPALRSQYQAMAERPPEPSLDVPQFAVDVPPLNIVIQIIGSRGDVQPFIALGQVLKNRYHHRVRVATHPTFQTFVEENGLEFFSLGGDPSELMAFMVKNPGLMPGFDSLKAGDVGKRRKAMWEMLLGGWRACIEPGNGASYAPATAADSITGDRPFVADAIIANPPSFGHVHCAEKLGIPLHLSFTMPWSPTTAFPHPLANIQSSNADSSVTNFLSYALVDMMTWQGLGDLVNRFREKTLGLDPVSVMWSSGMISRLKVPHTYCWSPALIPKPNDYGPEISVSGFYFLSLASSYTPPPDLAAFLEAGPPPVYIGFGSIVVDDPNAMTEMVFEAIKLSGVRALVSKGWGGMGGDDLEVPEGVFLLGNCPHDWLFPRCSAVVHHGGAGTTSAGIRSGRATVVVPFFGDQPFWGSMVARSGAGPAPIPYNRLTAESLAENIKMALSPETQAKATELGEKIRDEDGTENGAKSFHASLVQNGLATCDVLADRVAVWKIRGTQIKLSALAASILVSEGKIENGYGGLKLWRHREWECNTGPIEPIFGGAGALMGTVTSMMMGVSDIPMGALKGYSKHKGKQKEGTATPPVDDSASIESTGTGASDLIPTETNNSLETTSSSGTISSKTKKSPNKRPSRPRSESSNGGQISLDVAMGAGRGVGNIVKAGIKSPMDFALGIAQGFRNAPRLYGDTTIRPQEKITGISSGLRAASKEFGFGLYDGITGLVTQPIRGAKEEGGVGFVKGFGKGIGGLVLKPGAGMWGIPGYMMKGLHQELRAITGGNTVAAYLMTARAAQGTQELAHCTTDIREYVMANWDTVRKGKKKQQLKWLQDSGKRLMSYRESISPSTSTLSLSTPPPQTPGIPELPPIGTPARAELPQSVAPAIAELPSPDAPALPEFPPRSIPAIAELPASTNHMRSDASNAPPSYDSVPAYDAPSFPQEKRTYPQEKRPIPSEEVVGFDTEEMEKAIRDSVATTSTGNQSEDEAVERAIRASLAELKNSMATGVDEEEALRRAVRASAVEHHGINSGEDSEFEEALRKSLETPTSSAAATSEDEDEQLRRALEASQEEDVVDEEEELRKAIEESEKQGATPMDEELRKAMEQSAKEQQAKQERLQMEDEILMRHIYEQSLQEEEVRKKREEERQLGLERALMELLGSGEGSSKDASQDFQG